MPSLGSSEPSRLICKCAHICVTHSLWDSSSSDRRLRGDTHSERWQSGNWSMLITVNLICVSVHSRRTASGGLTHSLLPLSFSLLSCLHQCHSSLGEQHQSHLAESRRGTRCCRVCTRRQLWLRTASDASASASLHKLSNLAEQFARRTSCAVECCAHAWRQWSLAWHWLRQ